LPELGKKRITPCATRAVQIVIFCGQLEVIVPDAFMGIEKKTPASRGFDFTLMEYASGGL